MISVVIPAYNEAKNIGKVVAGVRAACRGFAYEVVVVNDGSSDGTREVLRRLAGDGLLRVVEHGTRRGYDHALSSGVRAARGSVVAIVDGDGQTEVSLLGGAVRTLEKGEVIVGCRQNRESRLRRVNSQCYRLFLGAVFGLGLSDINGKPKIFWKKDLCGTRPSGIISGVYDLLLLLEAKRRGLAIREVPVRHLPRLSGRSKMRPLDIPRIAALVLRLRLAGRGRVRGRPDVQR